MIKIGDDGGWVHVRQDASAAKNVAIAAAGCGGYDCTAATREPALTLGLPIR